MMKLRNALLGLSLVVIAPFAMAEPMSLDQAVSAATAAHPGEVIKAYQETKRGQEVWEVKIAGEDGKQWEVYYAVNTGELVMEKIDD